MLVKCMEKVGKQEGVWGQIAGVGTAGPSGQGRDTAATCEQVEQATLVVWMGSVSLSWLPGNCSRAWGLTVG